MPTAARVLLVVFAAGCNLPPLTERELVDPESVDAPGWPDAGGRGDAGGDQRSYVGATDANAEARAGEHSDGGADALRSADPCASVTCPAEDICHSSIGRCFRRERLAHITGQVRDACTNEPVGGVKVWYDGIRTCSAPGKGNYTLRFVQVGMHMLLTATAQGYEPYGEAVVVEAGGTIREIMLVPASGCERDGGVPALACTCVDVGCNPS
jgi:hypothetical protein